jgi:hypothetical protein
MLKIGVQCVGAVHSICKMNRDHLRNRATAVTLTTLKEKTNSSCNRTPHLISLKTYDIPAR